MCPYSREHYRRQGLTVLELLVVVAILGILMGLGLPAVVSAREAARRMMCTSNLRQLGLAFQQYHDARGLLPSAWRQANRSTSLYGWPVPLLPFMEQANLRDSLDCHLPITAPSSSLARETSLAVMLCPSDIAKPSFPLYVEEEEEEGRHPHRSQLDRMQLKFITNLPTANYVGVFGTLEPDDDYPAPIGDGSVITGRRVRFADLRRGLSRTLIVGERTMAMIPSTWLGVDIQGEDATCRLVGSAITRPNCTDCDECEFASRHAEVVNFLWGDGHIGVLSDEIDSAEFRRLARRH